MQLLVRYSARITSIQVSNSKVQILQGFATMPRNKSFMKRKPPTARKPPLTHFLCVPLVNAKSRPILEASHQQFRNEVLADPEHALPMKENVNTAEPSQQSNSQGDETVAQSATPKTKVHPKSIRPVGTLHCTLGVMSLNEGQLSEAVALLQNLDIAAMLSDSVDHKASSGSTLAPTSEMLHNTASHISIDLKGLISMHTPTKTSILYIAPHDLSNRLYRFCEALQTLFKEKSFMVRDDRPLKLHATIINTIYAKGRKKPSKGLSASASDNSSTTGEDRSQGHGPDADAPLKIDARELLDQYSDYIWAENLVLDRIAICEMGAKKKVDDSGNVIDEEYTEVASVMLPS